MEQNKVYLSSHFCHLSSGKGCCLLSTPLHENPTSDLPLSTIQVPQDISGGHLIINRPLYGCDDREPVSSYLVCGPSASHCFSMFGSWPRTSCLLPLMRDRSFACYWNRQRGGGSKVIWFYLNFEYRCNWLLETWKAELVYHCYPHRKLSLQRKTWWYRSVAMRATGSRASTPPQTNPASVW